MPATRCRDIWHGKHESCRCARVRARPCRTVCAMCAVKFVIERGQGGKCGCETPSSSFMHIFGSLSTLRIGVAPDGRAAQSRSWGGSLRSLCRTTVASLKFTRTAGNRRPFTDCSSSRSEALSPSLSLSPPRKRSDDQSRKISWVIAQLSERLKQLCDA